MLLALSAARLHVAIDLDGIAVPVPTPLHLAVTNPGVSAHQALQAAGADPHTKTPAGREATAMAHKESAPCIQT